MGLFLVRRLALSIFALFGALVVTFFMVHMAPVNPARQYAGLHATTEQLAAARKLLSLDRSVFMQIVVYGKNFFTGNWGVSIVSKQPVRDTIGTSLPYTLELVFLAGLIGICLAIPLGVLSAHRKDQWPDHMSRILSVGLIAIPTFWLALGLQYLLTGKLHMLPLSGAFSYETLLTNPVTTVTGFPLVDSLITGNFAAFWDHCLHLVMPVLALTAMSIGALQRLTRSSMVEILSEDYIVGVRSYGMSERNVLWQHGIKNAMGVLATFAAMVLAWLLVNTFLIESIFGWPGIGSQIVAALESLDYPVIIAVTLISAVSYLILNTIADVLVAAADPRVRLSR